LLYLRRKFVLTFIDMHYEIDAAAMRRIRRLEDEARQMDSQHMEEYSKEAWTAKQLLEALMELDPRKAEAILVERQVNELDPDFSFRRAMHL